MSPDQPEPYILGMRLARKLQRFDAVNWAAAGVLRTCWSEDYKSMHREAENVAAEAIATLKKQQRNELAQTIEQSMAEARRCDLAVRLVWTGEGDLDLMIEEPSGSVCSFENRSTAAGGLLLHDGYGPDAENCYEEYVCPLAISGDYRIRVKHSFGKIVGQRARLTVIRHQGTAEEVVETSTVTIGAEEATLRVNLADGRRQQLRVGGAVDVRRKLSGLKVANPRTAAGGRRSRGGGTRAVPTAGRPTPDSAGRRGWLSADHSDRPGRCDVRRPCRHLTRSTLRPYRGLAGLQ
ncbi:MAG: hypothetical protein R3B90_16995 [Planctomycetaceae bacterium]